MVDSGEAEISTADITPFLQLLGDGAGVASPVPANGRVTLGRERGATLLDITGKVANNNVQARLVAASRSEIGGEVSLERVSLPWLVAAWPDWYADYMVRLNRPAPSRRRERDAPRHDRHVRPARGAVDAHGMPCCCRYLRSPAWEALYPALSARGVIAPSDTTDTSRPRRGIGSADGQVLQAHHPQQLQPLVGLLPGRAVWTRPAAGRARG